MSRLLCVICCCLLCFSADLQGQTRIIDFLKHEIRIAQDPDSKLQALFSLGEQRQSLNTDTLCKYAFVAKTLSLTQNSLSQIALAEYYVANCYVKQGKLDTALQICNRYILKLGNINGSANPLKKLRTLKAQILVKSNKYKEGLAEVYKVLRTAEQAQDTLTQMIAKNGIGWINMEMDQTSEALKWFFRALKTSDKTVYHEKNSNIYSNIAGVYKQLHRNDSAEYYIKKSLDFSRKEQNLFFLANSLSILADIYIDTKRPALAEAPLKEALSIREKIGDPFYVVSDISLLAIYYSSISEYEKGIALSLTGIEMAEKFNLSSKLPYLYQALGENYKAAGDYINFSKTLEKIQVYKDSMYSTNSASSRAEMDAKYNLEKKEHLILLQNFEISRKNNLIYGSLAVLFFTSLMGWLLFSAYKKDQQIKLLKMQAEEKQIAVHAVISGQEMERKRISRDLHDNIGAYATVLIASTEQLKDQAGEPGTQLAAQTISDNAKNIMSSLQETIWVLSNDAITITDFIDRFKLYARKILRQFPGIQIIFKEELEEDFALSPSEALHLVRIMQEALQNTIKHAAPKNILVTVEAKKAILISIKDDGIGFVNDTVAAGNGLLNMKHRVKEAGYQLKIISSAEGTEVMLMKNRSFAVL